MDFGGEPAAKKSSEPAADAQPAGLIDLDSMLGGGGETTAPASGGNNLMGNDMMDLFGGAPAQTNS